MGTKAGPLDAELDDFVITCQKCGSTNCRTDRNFWPEMRGECKIICLDCDNKEFCVMEE